MKLLFVLENFTLGGVEKVTLLLIKEILLLDESIEIDVFALSSEGSLYEDYCSCVKCVCLKQNPYIGFRSYVIKENPDLVVFTKGGLSRFRLIVPFFLNMKFVVIQHTPIKLAQYTFRNHLRVLGAAVLYKCMDKVICVSDGIKKDLVKVLGLNNRKVVTIYNPVITPEIDKLALSDSIEYSDYFLCVGRLHYQKGYDFLVEIVRYVKQHRQSVKVVVLGDGPDKKYLSQKIKDYDLESNIVLHGEEVNPYKYIKGARAMLLTSRWEGLPTVLVEAAYLKTPTISFDCDFGPKELLRDGEFGRLIKQGDVVGFSEAILETIEGRRMCYPDVNDFHALESSKNYLSLFQSCIEN